MKILGALLVLAVLAIPTGVRAGDHKADVYLAGSYLNASGSRIHLGGWHAAATVTLPNNHLVGLTLDASSHFIGEDRTQLTFMVGPRISPNQDGMPKRIRMFYAHALVFGFVHRSGWPQNASASAGAIALGAGYDVRIKDSRTWFPRIQADYIRPFSDDVGDGFRVSVGVLYRLGH